MCLAKVHLNTWENEPEVKDIAYMRLNGGQTELKMLLGEEKIVQGRVVEVDFATSKILIDNRIDASKFF
jgi:predicted RNA-binding protein